MVYQLSRQLSLEIFTLSKNFPKEEMYSYPVKYCGCIFSRILP
ncbi:MAG: hypothetical protein L6422_05765 [Candidatus Marinimicrobia bacterium]|nr:hypothetical protein [Candidatus Neomarinimicrobiota bacterium]